MDIWTVTGSWVTALATIGLVILGLWAGRTAVATLKQTKIDSIAQSRPYVYASVVPGLAGEGMYDLVLKNTGQSIARNISITCPDMPEAPDDIAEAIADLFGRKFDLPPQASIRVYWRMELTEGAIWSDGSKDPAGMPSDATLIVEYTGDIEGRKVYRDSQRIDSGIYKMAPVASAGPDVKSSFSPEHKDLHKMLALIAQSVRELGR